MKNKIIIIIFLLLWGFPTLCLAVVFEESNELKEARLIETYGISNYYDCRRQQGACSSVNVFVRQRCLPAVEYCLRMKQLREQPLGCPEGYFYNPNNDRCLKETGCASGHERVGDQCLPECQNNATRVGDGCVCNDGYVKHWLNENYCATYTEICFWRYGQNTYGNEDGCLCREGYKWNKNRTGCTLNEDKTVETYTEEEKKEITETNNDLNSKPSSNKGIATCPKNSYLNTENKCYCNAGYASFQSQCVKIPENAHAAANSIADAWLCDEGYEEINGSCVLVAGENLKESPTSTPLQEQKNSSTTEQKNNEESDSENILNNTNNNSFASNNIKTKLLSKLFISIKNFLKRMVGLFH